MITPIPNKTAKGLVEYCKQMVGLPYWCGCYGQTATAELLKRKKAQYPVIRQKDIEYLMIHNKYFGLF